MLGEAEASDETFDTTVGGMLKVDLVASLLSVKGEAPIVLTVDAPNGGVMLPVRPYLPVQHRDLESGLLAHLKALAGVELDYLEQLFTLGERVEPGAAPVLGGAIAIGYLGLVAPEQAADADGVRWRSCFDYLPWEDRRKDYALQLTETLKPRLMAWAEEHGEAGRMERVQRLFGFGGALWDDERARERFDLLCEAGLVGMRQPNEAAAVMSSIFPEPVSAPAMSIGHKRILASALGRLRARIRSRPLAVDLMPDDFTLFELQRTVEAILGPSLHKQNFRRLVEGSGLVEATGAVRMRTGGRPAKLFRFRPDARYERPNLLAAGRSTDSAL